MSFLFKDKTRMIDPERALPGRDERPFPIPDTHFVLGRVRQVTAHEIGHTLGLSHNYIASTYERASVMDYPAPRVRLTSGGDIDVSQAYEPAAGDYDVWVIRWGYGTFPAGTERDSLAALVREGLAKGYLYLSDADARPDHADSCACGPDARARAGHAGDARPGHSSARHSSTRHASTCDASAGHASTRDAPTGDATGRASAGERGEARLGARRREPRPHRPARAGQEALTCGREGRGAGPPSINHLGEDDLAACRQGVELANGEDAIDLRDEVVLVELEHVDAGLAGV